MPGREGDHSLSSGAEFKNVRSYTRVFMAQCSIKHMVKSQRDMLFLADN
jgi:hypothetical protein